MPQSSLFKHPRGNFAALRVVGSCSSNGENNLESTKTNTLAASRTELIAADLPVVSVKSLSFTNVHGGTGRSDWDHDQRLVGPINVRVVKAWEDYEIGYRFIGQSCDPRLDEYLDRVAPKDNRNVFFGQFELAEGTPDEAAEALMLKLAAVCQVARLDDEECFVRQPDGKWVNLNQPSMIFESAADLIGELSVTLDAADTVEKAMQDLQGGTDQA